MAEGRSGAHHGAAGSVEPSHTILLVVIKGKYGLMSCKVNNDPASCKVGPISVRQHGETRFVVKVKF